MEDSTPDEYTVEITHADKVLFPDDGYTKGDLIDYYEAVAEVMLPHLLGRPVTMCRFPEGIGEEGFFQKEAPDYFPHWITRREVETKQDNGKTAMAVVDNPATLIYIANLASITQHIWLSRLDNPHHPDKLIFDLDPTSGDFANTRWAAKTLRAVLEDELGLTAFVMTTGSKGLHVVVPLDETWDFEEVRAFAQDVASLVEHRHSEQLTTEQRKDKRGNRIYVDTQRNSYAQTSVAPYSVRALPGAPIATPLEWDELDDDKLTAQSLTLENVCSHLDRKSDPWQAMWQQVCSLEEAHDALDTLLSEMAMEEDTVGHA